MRPTDRNRLIAIAQIMRIEPEWHELDELNNDDESPLVPPMVTLQILGGRKEKIRAGDVLGALTGDAGLLGAGRQIDVTEFSTYVAVVRNIAREAVRKLSAGKVKGKTVKVRALDEKSIHSTRLCPRDSRTVCCAALPAETT